MTKYIAYYRVSTDRQGKSGLGIDGQKEMVRQFLDSSRSFPPVAEFVETESGKKVDRTELRRAVAACRVHGATLVIAKLDRLARDQRFLMDLVDSGVDVLFCDMPGIPTGATGRYTLQNMAAIAELEAGLISDRTKAALRAKVERDGQWDRKASHHLVPGAGQKAATAVVRGKANQRALYVVGLINELKAEGVSSLNALARSLNEKDIPTARGGAWTATSVRRVIGRAETAPEAANW